MSSEIMEWWVGFGCEHNGLFTCGHSESRTRATVAGYLYQRIQWQVDGHGSKSAPNCGVWISPVLRIASVVLTLCNVITCCYYQRMYRETLVPSVPEWALLMSIAFLVIHPHSSSLFTLQCTVKNSRSYSLSFHMSYPISLPPSSCI